jgi:hypothetical protein
MAGQNDLVILLVILAQQYLCTDYLVLANWFLVCCMVIPLIAVIVFATEKKWQNWLSDLWV